MDFKYPRTRWNLKSSHAKLTSSLPQAATTTLKLQSPWRSETKNEQRWKRYVHSTKKWTAFQDVLAKEMFEEYQSQYCRVI
ncbi:hypothetical protein CMV_009168 [Castanea mollissima]|uniref:Uncharacterized protein n=1 Tax=Castanea mollissima TaxID=60419 RepID=A0A8J4VNH1_9ROSI|nr:hypothetical protein CMV_009168 [Castanea mollissima]